MFTTTPETVTTPTWLDGNICAFDLETTGPDVENDRVVTAAVAVTENGHIVHHRTWLINPGIEIPPGATAVHAITNEKARTEGQPPGQALAHVVKALTWCVEQGYPIVSFNAAFDWTLLDRDVTRNIPGTPMPRAHVLDPYVLDKQVDTYRKGPRRLENVATHYNIPEFNAHDALADAIAAVHVARALIKQHPELHLTLEELQHLQAKWRAQQQASLKEHLQRTGKPCDDIWGDWPIRNC